MDYWRDFVRVTVIYLEYTHSRGQARVYTQEVSQTRRIYLEIEKIERQFSKGPFKIIEMFRLQKYASKSTSILCCELFPFPFFLN